VKDEQLQQRIKYLMEHGGVWDDPLADIRRGVRWAVGLGALALLIALVDLTLV
jgi:hypothetical protein